MGNTLFFPEGSLSSHYTYWTATLKRTGIRQVTDEENATAPIFNPKDGCFYYLDNANLKRIFGRLLQGSFCSQ